MFTLLDGREQLYQWDLHRQILVDDSSIDEVHFCNKTSDCSLVVPVTDKVANIPNILLQDDFPIRVYAYCKDGYTKIEEVFKVKPRSKPADYVYEETTVITINELLDRAEEAVETAEQSASNANTTATELHEYVDTHKLHFKDDNNGNVTLQGVIPEGGGGGSDADLSDYYTKEEVDTALDDKADKEHTHDEYVYKVDFNSWETDFISALEAEYYDKAETDAKLKNKVNTSTTINGKPLSSNVYLEWGDLATSETMSWSGWLSIGQSISADTVFANSIGIIQGSEAKPVATQEYVDNAIAGSATPEPDLSNYYTKAEVNALFEGIATAEGGSY